MSKSNYETPSVLAFEKKLVPSDAYMYQTTWEHRTDKAIPLKLIQKSVRGTFLHRLSKKEQQNIAEKLKNANPQTIDACMLSKGYDTLKLQFTLKILSGIAHPCACNNEAFFNAYQQMVQQYIKEDGFSELGKRYAVNIANGRFLWRNRVGAESLAVRVNLLTAKEPKTWLFDPEAIRAIGMGEASFASDNQEVIDLGKAIAETLAGNPAQNDHLLLQITAFAKVGEQQEVYPSEEMVLDNKTKGSKSKILYEVGLNNHKIAALHSQKVGNALRTIDTWYPQFDDNGIPIAIDPYGCVTTHGKAYRNPSVKKHDFYSIFDKTVNYFAENHTWPDEDKLALEDKHYMMAMLVRGGVFGKSQKS